MPLPPYVVLSRKYRPKALEDLIGQEVLAKSLKSCIDNKKVPHAFLFHGIRGTGKTTTARILSRCLNCVGNDGAADMTSNPCGTCRSCLAIDIDQHMDIMEFDAASRTGVDDIRDIIDSTQYAPILGRYKIYIIDEVHMLSKSAFNALLKTLEEPPTHVKFVFATTEIHKIPETILSRCMVFQLKPVSRDTISEYLKSIADKEDYEVNQDAADLIAEESGGSVRDALSLIEQAMMLAPQKIIDSNIIISMIGGTTNREITDLLNHILSSQTKNALSKVAELLANGADPIIIHKNLQSCLYKTIVKKVEMEDTDKSGQSLRNLLYLWQILLKQTESIKNANFPEYVLNAAIIVLSLTASMHNVGDAFIKEASPEKIVNNIIDKFQGIKISEIE